MNVKLFGHRCLVEYYKPASSSVIIIPDAAGKYDTHRMGTVRYVGDGKIKNDKVVPSLVNPGDIVLFQINQVMVASQNYRLAGKHCLNLHQEDLIARVHGDDLSVDNLEMLGDYLLLKHFIRHDAESKIYLPDNIVKESAPDFIYFRCAKKGSGIGSLFAVGDELVVNFGRLTPLFMIQRNSDGTSKNQEFCYTRKDWVDGVVEDNS